METKKFCLTERQMPTQWYNIVADMPNKPLPPLHPATKQPVTKEQMSAIFAEELIDQEMSTERFIDIPEEVQEIYKIWRPSPLVRATGLEKALGTPAKIYFKNESVSPAGSHKPNTAVPQAYYNYKQGIRHLTTETGAGQWGAAIAFAAKHFGLDVQVFMVKVSYEQKPYRRLMMNTWGAECIASPSTITASGRAALERDPDCSGSLGLAISEAVEMALQHPEDTRYCLGSVLNHVILHQTVIGQEAVAQMEMAGAEPDVVIGCFGGGSNFAGLGFPFLRRNLVEGRNIRIVAVEPSSCPKLTRGTFQYDFGDVAGFTPLLPMYTLGHDFQPSDIHALPRGGFDREPAVEGRTGRGPVAAADRDPRGRHPLRQDRGDHPGARVDPRHRGGNSRGVAGQGGGNAADDPVQPLGQRRDRPLRLRAVPGRGAAGLRAGRRRDRKDGQPVKQDHLTGGTIRDRKGCRPSGGHPFSFPEPSVPGNSVADGDREPLKTAHIRTRNAGYRDPSHKKTMPTRMRMRSTALARRFRSRKSRAPQANETTTEPRRTIDTTEIMASGSRRAMR